MKTIVTILSGAALLGVVACGPSAEQLEKQKQDSLRADSAKQAEAAAMKMQMMQDSLAKVAEQAKADSIRVADSIAAATAAPVKK